MEPDTEYRVRLGTLALDDAYQNDVIVSDEELARRLPPANVHDAFGSTNIRRLLRSVPQYMILGDHEIEDNWPQDRIAEDRNKRVLFTLA